MESLTNQLDDIELANKSATSKEFICNRHIDDITEDELKHIVEKMKDIEFSGCKFLDEKDDIQKIIENDKYSIEQAGLSTNIIIETFENLLKEMHKNISNKEKNGGDITRGMVGMINDQINGFKGALDMLFGKNAIPRNPGSGPQIININTNTGWTLGVPNPVSMLKYHDSQWSLKTRSCSLIIKNNSLHYVGEIVWNGSQECPFKHPDDKCYHGYEYGDRDYIIDIPVLDGEKSRDQMIIVSDLVLHMIREHDFWGSGVFRIDPIKFANLLGIGPEPIKTPSVAQFIKDLLDNEIDNKKSRDT